MELVFPYLETRLPQIEIAVKRILEVFNMGITPIPDREAAKILGVTYKTVRNAVDREDLIRIPMAGQVQHVAKEQVELFLGRKKIIVGSLTLDKIQKWQEVSNEIKNIKGKDNEKQLEDNMSSKNLVDAINDLLRNYKLVYRGGEEEKEVKSSFLEGQTDNDKKSKDNSEFMKNLAIGLGLFILSAHFLEEKVNNSWLVQAVRGFIDREDADNFIQELEQILTDQNNMKKPQTNKNEYAEQFVTHTELQTK